MLAKALVLSGAARLQRQAKISTTKPWQRGTVTGAFGWVRQANVRSLGFALGWCTPCHFISRLSVFLAFPGTNINSQCYSGHREGQPMAQGSASLGLEPENC